MKKEYLKKIKNKKVSLQERPALAHAPSLPLKVLSYEEAIIWVRTTFDKGSREQGQLFLEQIVDQVKNIPEPALYLMNVHLESMDIDAARILVDRLLKQFPLDNMVLRHCARFYQMSNEIDQALVLLKKAITLYPKSDENFDLLGTIYLSIGDKNKAMVAFNKTLSINPLSCSALLGKAKILKNSADDEFVGQLESLLNNKKIEPENLALLHYALAWIFEEKNPDRHFEYLNKANALASISRPYILKNESQRVEKILEIYSTEAVAVVKPNSSETLAPILIVGLARSGTTLLEQMLGAHSGVVGVGESTAFRVALKLATKKGNPLPEANSFEKVENIAECIKQISTIFQAQYFIRAVKNQRVVDKSIDNAAILGMILMVYPNARVIHLQRHPLDIIYSCYQQNFAIGNNYSLNLESSAENYKIHKRLMDHWIKLFPKQIISVRYENLVSDQEQELKKILGFCGLDWEENCLEYYKQVGLVKTASEEQVRRPVYSESINKWKRVEKHLQPAIKVLGELANY